MKLHIDRLKNKNELILEQKSDSYEQVSMISLDTGKETEPNDLKFDKIMGIKENSISNL